MDAVYAPRIQCHRHSTDSSSDFERQLNGSCDLWPYTTPKQPNRLSKYCHGYTRSEANDRQRWHRYNSNSNKNGNKITMPASPPKKADYTMGISKKGDIPWILLIPKELRFTIFRYVLPTEPSKFRFYTDCDSDITGSGSGSGSGTGSGTGAGAGTGMVGTGTKPNLRRSDHPAKYSLAVLRVNRQIYHESLSVLYSENLFHFIGFNHLTVLDFIRRLSPDAREVLRQIRLTLLSDLDGNKRPENHDLFCSVIHDYLPFLSTLRSDPVIWI